MKKQKIKSFLLVIFVLVLFFSQTITAQATTTISKKSITINVNSSYTLSIKGSRKTVTWASSNTKVATVSSKGKVKGIKKGTCTITAKVGTKKLSCKVTVKQPVTNVSLNKTSKSIKVGEKYKLKVSVTPTNANNKTIAWSSSNPKIAIVNCEGVIEGISPGKATITAISIDGSNKKATCKVTVKEDPPQDTGTFHKLDNDETDPYNWGANTNNSIIKISVPNSASQVNALDNKLSFVIKNEWIDVKYLYEIVNDINSAPECELKVRSITSELPMSLADGYSGVYIIQDLDELFSTDDSYAHDIGSGRINLDDVWYISIGSCGASYLYESSKSTSKDDLTYSTIIEESYNYYDDVAIHKKIVVNYYNYIDYYNSLQTTIEKNQANDNYKVTMNTIKEVKMSTTEFVEKTDITFCLLKSAKLI